MSSSYFESLGRQESAPFTMDELNYAETEPDLVKAMNEQINENIKDRRQFFTDNITAFNQTQAAKKNRLSDLAVLTKTGREIIEKQQKYRKWDEEYDKYKKIYDNDDERFKFVDASIKIDNADKDIQVESAHAVGHTVKTGESDGQPIGLTDIADFEMNVVTEDYRNGNSATDAMLYHLNQYEKIAFEKLTYDNKFYNELSYSDKIKFRRNMYARYIQMWREEHPNISDRQIISKIMPVLMNEDRRLDGESAVSHVNSSREEVSNIRVRGAINYIKAGYANSQDPENEQYVDGIFTRNSIIQVYEAEAIGLGIDNPMKYANEKFVNEVIIPNVGEFTEEEIKWLLNDYKFKAKDGHMTSYADLQTGAAQKIEAAWLTQQKKDNDGLLVKRLDDLTKQVDEKDYQVTEDDINIFNGTDYEQVARNLKERSNLHPLQLRENANYVNSINAELDTRSKDIKIFGDQVLNGGYQNDVYRHLKNKTDKRFRELMKTYEGQDNQVELATQQLLKEIREKKFDDVQPASFNETLSINIEDSVKLYEADTLGTLSSDKVHAAEEPYIQNAINSFLKGEKLSNYWYEVAKSVDGRNGQKVAYDRLKALDMLDKIGGPISGFEAVIDLGDLDTTRLITNNPNESTIYRAILSNNENENELLNRIINPEVNDNGGINAIKGSNGQYITVEEGQPQLEELTVEDILVGISDGTYDQNTEFGLFSIRGIGLQELYNAGLINLDDSFDKAFQIGVIKQRLRYKSNNKLQFSGADGTYRRLITIPKEDKERLKEIIGDLGPYLDADNLSAAALTELVEQNL
jgi:DNA-binding HxlR family transcriptional regulator